MAVSRVDVERFRDAIIEQIGLQFDDAKLGFLSGVLERRPHRLGHSSDRYLRDLELPLPPSEYAALAHELTVGETYFFRSIEQFRALAEVVLPARTEARLESESGRGSTFYIALPEEGPQELRQSA